MVLLHSWLQVTLPKAHSSVSAVQTKNIKVLYLQVIKYLPSQEKPLPLNPASQEQLKLPMVSSHEALAWHGILAHSLISVSEGKRYFSYMRGL